MARKRFTVEQIIMKQRLSHSALAYQTLPPEAKLPSSQALNSILWGGLHMVLGLI